MARVVINDLDPRVLQHIIVLFAEKSGDNSRDQRLDFADDDAIDAGIENE